MSVEERLRQHFSGEAARLTPPAGRLAEVRRRGRRRQLVERTAVALVVVALLAAVPLAVTWLGGESVVVTPGPSPTATPTGGAPTATASEDEGGEREQDAEEAAREEAEARESERERASEQPSVAPPLAVGNLRAPVLAYHPASDGLGLVDRDGTRELWPGVAREALPDGRGGVVFQAAVEPRLLWLPGPLDGEASSSEPVTLVAHEGEGTLHLRGFLPDGRLLYSVRPPDERLTEDDTAAEEFFALALDEGAQPELVASSLALESWTVGPVVASGGQLVHAACHLHCSLLPGLPGDPGAEALYHGGGSDAGPGAAIEGLAATPDGRVLAHVELDITQPDAVDPQLVLLDGTSFAELARIGLGGAVDRPGYTAVVSLSADGQRVLVALGGPPTTPRVEVVATLLVDGALTEQPDVRAVDDAGVLRWFDPVVASGPGGPVTQGEHEVALALRDFARAPSAEALAQVPLAASGVRLGLGPALLGEPRPPDDLADPGAWALEPEGNLFRARTGPFSALDPLADAGEVRVTGGPHAHCAAPPVPAPAEVADLRRVSIQPTAISSCLEWWTVDLFLTGDGEVAAVTLDLWEP